MSSERRTGQLLPLTFPLVVFCGGPLKTQDWTTKDEFCLKPYILDTRTFVILFARIASTAQMRPIAAQFAHSVVVCMFVCWKQRLSLLNRSRWCSADSRGPKNHILDGVHIGATWRIRPNDPCAAAMPPSDKLLWPRVYICCCLHAVTGYLIYDIFRASPNNFHE